MKSGLAHVVTENTGVKLQAQLAGQMAHSFIALSELGITINSAEIDGVYTATQFGDLAKIKQGLWKCEYSKWHKKREECECQKERKRKMYEERKELEWQEQYGTRTDEEKAQIRKRLDEIRADLEKSGILKANTHDNGKQ